MMRRPSVLLLRRGISQLCKNGESTLTVTLGVITITKTYEPWSLLPESLFRVHPLVTQALADNKPVVALESTIITHGMPYPHNLRYFLCNVHVKENICNFTTIVFLVSFYFMTMGFSTAKEVEDIVRAEGATPATVGVIDGEIRVGLSSRELDQLARCEGSLKVSRRDLPYVLSKVRHAVQILFWLSSQSQSLASIWPSDPPHPSSLTPTNSMHLSLCSSSRLPARHLQPQHLSAQIFTVSPLCTSELSVWPLWPHLQNVWHAPYWCLDFTFWSIYCISFRDFVEERQCRPPW